jgi:hypothetical protein
LIGLLDCTVLGSEFEAEAEAGAESESDDTAQQVCSHRIASDSQRTQRQSPKLEAEVATRNTQAAGTRARCSSWWFVKIVVTLAPSSSDSMVPSQSGPMAKM